MLKGQSKTDYQRDYMRRKRAGQVTPKQSKPKPQPIIVAKPVAEMDFDEFERFIDQSYGKMTLKQLERAMADLNAGMTREEWERSVRIDRIIHWQGEAEREIEPLVGIGAEDWVLSDEDRRVAAELIGADIVDPEFEYFRKWQIEHRKHGLRESGLADWRENWRWRCEYLAKQMRETPWLYRRTATTGSSTKFELNPATT